MGLFLGAARDRDCGFVARIDKSVGASPTAGSILYLACALAGLLAGACLSWTVIRMSDVTR